MRVLLSGCEGQLGQSFKKLFNQDHDSTKGVELIAFSRKDLDITDRQNLESKLKKHRPDFFINAAAYTAVDLAEERQDEAMAINADALKSIGELSERLKITPLHISTDYVFDGQMSRPYTEDDIPLPANVYGKTKLIGEKKLLQTCPSATILRTSWVFSEFGYNFLKTILNLSLQRQELSIVDDQFGGPTYAPHIAQALLEIAHNYNDEDKGRVYHFSGLPFVSRYEFASSVLEYAGVSTLLKKVNSDFFPTKAKRPVNSRLNSSRIQERFNLELDWKKGVKESLANLI